jgi:WD40 repeat protein
MIGNNPRKPKAHTNKIFCVKFNPEHSQQVYSGSWDSTVKFWDVRSQALTHQINGTQTCGESVDMDSDLVTVVTGGAGGEGIKIWDLRNTSQAICDIDYDVSS